MSLFDMFRKSGKAEQKYFESRAAGERPEAEPEARPRSRSLPTCDRRINKDLFVELLKIMKTHDAKSTISIIANTTDGVSKATGNMINKGFLPRKIVAYLQQINMHHVDDALSFAKSSTPDEYDFYVVDDKTAARLNLPLGVVLYPLENRMNRHFGMVLVFKKALKNRKKLRIAISKVIKR